MRVMERRGWVAIIVVLVMWAVGAEAADWSKAQKLLQRPDQAKVVFSVHFVDLTDGRTVLDYHAEQAVPPASNMKLITTAVAVDTLGADFNYETLVGLYQGHLVIFGSGDPLLGDPTLAQAHGQTILAPFEAVAAALKVRGITTIAGDLIVDASIFDDQRFHPSWPPEQANRWYTAEIAGLNFNDNCIDVRLKPTQPGAAPLVLLEPDTAYVTINNQARTISKGDNTAWVAHTAEDNQWILKNDCRTEVVMSVPVTRPAAFTGFVLGETLQRQGIAIQGKLIGTRLRNAQGKPPEGFEVVASLKTPLQDVLTRCNTNSLNMAAECLFKTIGAYSDLPAGTVCKEGSWTNGREAVNRFLTRLNVDPADHVIDDGCGLSHNNRLTARCVTSVLSYMAKQPAAEIYRTSMATGNKGTLDKRDRFAGKQYEGRLYAKTGYIAGCRALSGYCQTKDGHWLAFSILTQKSTGRTTEVIDGIVKAAMD